MYNYKFINNQQLQDHIEYNRAKKDYLELKNKYSLLPPLPLPLLLLSGGGTEEVKVQTQPKKSFLSEWKEFRMERSLRKARRSNL